MPKIEIKEYFTKINDLIQLNYYDQAIHHCLYLLRQFPKMISIYDLLGRVYLETENYYGALDVYSRLLSTKPDDFINYILLEIIFEKLNQPEYQKICKRTASYLKPGDVNILQKEQPNKEILSYIPDESETFFANGKKLFDSKDFKNAAIEFEKAFYEKPSALYELFFGLACSESNLDEKAAMIFKNIIRKNPYLINGLRFAAYYSFEKNPVRHSYCLERLSELDPGFQNSSFSGKQLIPGPVELFVSYHEWTGFPNRKLLSGRLFSGDKFLDYKTGFLPNWLSLLPVNMQLFAEKPQTDSVQDKGVSFSKKAPVFSSNFKEEDTFFQLDYFRSQIIKDSNLNKSKTDQQSDSKLQASGNQKKSNLDEAFHYLEKVMTDSVHSDLPENGDSLQPEVSDYSAASSVIHPEEEDDSSEKIREAWNCFSTGEQAKGVAIYRDLIQNNIRLESIREDIQKLIVLFPDNQELSQLII